MGLLPDLLLQDVTCITPELLRERNIKALLLDVDNTLAHHNHPDPLEGVRPWLRLMQDEGFRLLILSNASKKRVQGFAGGLGLDFIHMAMKPLSSGYRRAIRLLGLRREEVAMVGDQIFTDIAGANRMGLTTILVVPAQIEDKILFRIRRWLEKSVIRRYHRRETGKEENK